MPTPTELVDRAFLRNAILSNIVEAARQRAESDKTNNYAITLGIIEGGDKAADARREIDSMFVQLKGLIAYLAILDIATSFERAFRDRLRNAVGEARKAVKGHYKLKSLSKVRERLIRDVDDFRGLGGIENLLGPLLDQTVLANLTNIRELRNDFAHGNLDIEIPPTLDNVTVRNALLTVAELMFE